MAEKRFLDHSRGFALNHPQRRKRSAIFLHTGGLHLVSASYAAINTRNFVFRFRSRHVGPGPASPSHDPRCQEERRV